MFNVIIIGGGPAGSTTGTLLKTYMPNLEVLIVEKEGFPRDHVGESQLPPISAILQEMGCWEKVEAADFPIKIGATYRWGSDPSLWDFEFLPTRFLPLYHRAARADFARVVVLSHGVAQSARLSLSQLCGERVGAFLEEIVACPKHELPLPGG